MNAQRRHKRYIPSKLIFELILLGEIWKLMSPLFLLGKDLESPSTNSSFYYQCLTNKNNEEKIVGLIKRRESQYFLGMPKVF
jgi:hypothetical protein